MPPPHHRFKKQRRITEPTIYRNPPYHSGMTPEPRTSTVFIDLEDHRNLPGNLTPTTEEHLQRLYWRFLGFNSCNAHAGVSKSLELVLKQRCVYTLVHSRPEKRSETSRLYHCNSALHHRRTGPYSVEGR
ncbi:hypothetical protein F2Q70_00023156 [Brassica cretica]|uniref:Uncharacterized protein n=1 Tax=Brassica cretica TaxID=69181 RepID=A0A8S9GPL4_BRACR|nr:hypothetical protein F2Q70_00023156 [Brassica cretica]